MGTFLQQHLDTVRLVWDQKSWLAVFLMPVFVLEAEGVLSPSACTVSVVAVQCLSVWGGGGELVRKA